MAIKFHLHFVILSLTVNTILSQNPNCRRIFFQRTQNTEITEWDHLLNAVYVAPMETDFSVYIAERGGVTFSYDTNRRNFIFAKETTKEILLKLNRANTSNINTYTDKSRNTSLQLSLQCTDTTECPGKVDIQFHQQGNREFREYRFSPDANIFINHRRVYKEENGEYILFHNRTGYWDIASIPTLKTQYTVRSQAFRLEFISEQHWFNQSGHPIKATLKCKRKQIDKCKCLNYGKCIENKDGYCWCVCRYGFTGQDCGTQIMKKCPKIKARGFRTLNYELGAIGTKSCPIGNMTLVMSCQMGEKGQPVWTTLGDCRISPGKRNDTTEEVLQNMVEYMETFKKNKKLTEKNADKDVETRDVETRDVDTGREDQEQNGSEDLENSDEYTITIKCILVLLPSVFLPLVHLLAHYCMENKMPHFFRTMSKHAYIGVIIWFSYIIAYQQKEDRTELTDFAYYLALVFVLTGYPFVVWESLSNSTEMRYLHRTINSEGKGKYIEHLIEADPSITLQMECFRMEKRSRLNSQRDQHGHVRYRREAYYRGSVTWCGGKQFHFKYCKNLSSLSDIQKSLKMLKGAQVVRLEIDSKVKFADQETALEFKNMRDAFVEQNKHHDKHYRFWVEKDIPGLQKEWLYYSDGLPVWMSMNIFVACSFLWLSWPYRILFNLYTVKTTFKIVKSVSNSCPIIIPDSINSTTAQATILDYKNNNNEVSASTTLLIGAKDERSHSWLLEEPPTYDESIYFRRASSPRAV